jgi:hypothetical protein
MHLRKISIFITAMTLVSIMGAGCDKDATSRVQVNINDPLGRWQTKAPLNYEIDSRETPHVVSSTSAESIVRFALRRSDNQYWNDNPPEITVRVFPHAKGVPMETTFQELLTSVREFNTDAALIDTSIDSLKLKYLDDGSGLMEIRHYLFDTGTFALDIDVATEPDMQQLSAIGSLIHNFETLK